MGKDQKQQRHDSKAEAAAVVEKPAGGAAAEAKREGPLPLSLRSIDAWLAIWFVIFAFTTTFTDLHNFTASVMGVEVKDLEGMTLLYPPKFLTDIYFKWARTVDPLLYENPVWWCVRCRCPLAAGGGGGCGGRLPPAHTHARAPSGPPTPDRR